ncbi:MULTISPECIES: flagellar hook-associated protein FlgL [Gammaproteobacteria]|uniref:flagellar hook-associated protein FlgL n=1 Tax=Gammaproteobacteria TaxID=1236 RepID=UPI000DCFA090|nr:MULTISPECIES: flagellar hook-associated protein FlgL [Gammaproteobacteria]RTE86155.1 flagellar hook-associated protein 3 [Aliidiomarina sp. B3213]TCZ91507.1 flagellar hook-associated protein 3 [Lysobacter sp. N42]
MRIPTNQLYSRGLDAVLDAQRKLVNVQNQIARETKILTPADDPVGKAQVMGLDDRISQNEQFQRNSNLLRNRLERSESVFSSITTGLDRARVLMVQSGNGVYDEQDRKALAEELKGIRDEVLGLMNSKDENGDYLFSGFQKRTESFSKNPVTGNYDYNGDDGRNQVQLSPSLRVTSLEPGSSAFQNVEANRTLRFADSTGGVSDINARVVDRDAFDSFHGAQYDKTQSPADNALRIDFDGTNIEVFRINQTPVTSVSGPTPYTPGEPMVFEGIELNLEGTLAAGDSIEVRLSEPTQNVVTTIDRFIETLETEGLTSDTFQSQLDDALENIDRGQSQLASTRAKIGGRLQVLENAFLTNADQEISNRETRSKIADVDYSEAMTELTKQDVSLQAAQATFTRITRLSLFDFIR